MQELLNDDIRRAVLEKITPSEQELLLQHEIVKTLVDALETRAEELGQQYSFIEEQGSTGKKQTQLSHTTDIDLFIGLDPQQYSKVIECDREIDRLLTQFAKEWVMPAVRVLDIQKMELAFSQHPYVSFEYRGLPVDILCCFDLPLKQLQTKGPITTVDRTIHHSRYVTARISETMREDIRILKSFLRACHTYGDRCAVGRMGFTGYSLELLVIQFGDLTNALRGLELLESDPLDPEGRSLEDLRNIPAFRDDYVYIIDPTDTDRNAAASFDSRAYRWTKKRIGNLRESSDTASILDLLLESPISTEALPDTIQPHAYAIEFESDHSVHYTILRDKLHSLARKIRQSLEQEQTGEERFGQVLSEVYIEDNSFALGFLIERPDISERFERRGPPLSIEDAVIQFKTHHPVTFERDGHIWTEVRRKWTDAQKCIQSLLKGSDIKGLTQKQPSNCSVKVLNVLYNYVLQIEQGFLIQG